MSFQRNMFFELFLADEIEVAGDLSNIIDGL